MKKNLQKLLAGLAMMTALAAPAFAAEETISDPLESANRVIFTLNNGLDVMFLEPAAKLYRFILPDYALDRVQHVFTNIREPLSAVNYVLQGDFSGAGHSVYRFVANSTVGLAGLYDVTGEQSESKLTGLGDTLGRWGMGTGPYLVLPLIGPSDFRDGIGLAGDYYADPVRIALHGGDANVRHPETVYTALRMGDGFDARSRLIKQIDDMRKNSLDFYAATRSIYLQRREAKIRGNSGGAPEIPNYN